MPLTRLTLKLALIPTLIFAALISLIRAQPYDDSELRAFLTPPEGCPAPCFMGIRPGTTTEEQALIILKNHKWVETVNNNSIIIRWRWNGLQPKILFTQREGELILNNDYDPDGTFENKYISSMRLTTTIPVGYSRLLFGSPDIVNAIAFDRDVVISAFYADAPFLSVQTTFDCPVTREKLWKSPMTIVWMSATNEALNDNFFVC